ncbi:hypothetical protein [Nocardia sp. NPDC002869]|uniref:hypothetical protein n=1 Tax=Nocardia sp. NPDC002869 TaxID=3161032 RepID=UPI00398C8380
MSGESTATELVDTCVRTFGAVDVLVNCAGSPNPPAPPSSTSAPAIGAPCSTPTSPPVEELLPAEWTAASATGTPEQCASRIADQFAAGADGVILHGNTPTELAPVLDAWRRHQPVLARGITPHTPPFK